MDDNTEEIDKYEAEIATLDKRREIMPTTEWPKPVMDLMSHYHGKTLPILTREQVYEIAQRLDSPGKMMRDSLPLVCVGEGIPEEKEGCPYVPGCPLEDAKIAPVGQVCPFESRMVDELFNEYMSSLRVEPTNMVETGQVKDLVSIDLIAHRITGALARGGLVDFNPVGITSMKHYSDGTSSESILYRKDLAAEAQLLDKLSLRKQTILRNMMATREMRAKYDPGERDDVASLIAKLKALREKQGSN